MHKDGGLNCLSVVLCTGALFPAERYHATGTQENALEQEKRACSFVSLPAQKTPQRTLSGAQERAQESNTTRTTSARTKPVRQEQTMHAPQTPDAPPTYIFNLSLYINAIDVLFLGRF